MNSSRTKSSPAETIVSILVLIVAGLLILLAIPLAILAMLLFNICDAISDTRAWKWFVGRRG